MYRHALRHHRPLRILLATSLLLTGLFPPAAFAKKKKERKPVVVSFGQPNIWTLEQAHYLLARMHMTNLDLQAKTLSDTDLDPNAVNGTRIEILKQLLSVGASFDQGVGFQNQRLVETARFDDARRRDLTTDLDHMRAQSMQLTFDIDRLKSERAQVSDGTSEAKKLDAEIKQKTDDQDAVTKKITDDSAEIQKLGAEPSGTPVAAAVPTPSASLPSSVLDDLVKQNAQKLLDAAKDPKLSASTALDNTIQLQYEIVSKQLTLLRDEVGPGERLVFLELPQSIYTTPGSGDEKMAQTWWHVNGYTHTDPLLRLLLELYEVEWKWKKIREVSAFQESAKRVPTPSCTEEERKTLTGYDRMYFDLKCQHDAARERVLRNLGKRAGSDFDRVEQGGARDTSQVVEAIRRNLEVQGAANAGSGQESAGSLNSFVAAKTGAATEDSARDTTYTLLDILSNPDPIVKSDPNDPRRPLYSFEKGIEFTRLDAGQGGNGPATRDIERRTVRTVEIIPRQSSLNVNDINETVKATGILAAFKFLFGFAGQVNFQRQREQFEQFVHQELFASGFGKGNRDFGWTFGAVPGTKRVAPGVRTTYAALVVPDDAESIVLSARGCYFPRQSYQPLDFDDTAHSDWSRPDRFKDYNCGDEQTYILPVPGGGDTSSFWVTNVDYQPARKGDFVTVSVRGNNFSSQMGVLVDGVALNPTVGLAQPNLMPRRAAAGAQPAVATDCATATGVCGSYERIDPQQIIFSFKMPANSDVGIPTITLVAPGKSVDLNALPNLTVNGEHLGKGADGNDEKLAEGSKRVKFMFGKAPTEALSITDLQLLNVTPGSLSVVALLTGTGFDEKKDAVYVNGAEMGVTPGTTKSFKSPTLYRLEFNLPADEELKVTVVRDKEVVTKSFANPAALKITGATVLGYDPPAGKKSAGVMTVKIEGAGFSPRLALGVEGASWRRSSLVIVSASEAIVKLIAPEPLVVITLTDVTTRGSARAVVQTPPAKKEEEKKEEKKEGEKK
jgi:hypothetical protein